MHLRKNVLAWKDNSQASKARVYPSLFLCCLLVAIDLWCIVTRVFLFPFFLVIAPSFPPPEPLKVMLHGTIRYDDFRARFCLHFDKFCVTGPLNYILEKKGLRPRTQASSRYPNDQRRLGTRSDIFSTSLTGDVIFEIAEDDWERGWSTRPQMK